MNGIIFSDTGFQKAGWGKSLYDQERVIQEYFEQADHILSKSTQKLAFNSTVSEMQVLPDSYVLAYILQASLAGYAKHQGTSVDRIAGIGVGAYAAGYAAGVFSFADGLYLVSKWAHLYHDHLLTHSLRKLSITGVRSQDVKKLCSGTAHVSEFLSPDRVTIAGKTGDIEAFEQKLARKFPDAQVDVLDVELGIYGNLDEVCQTYKQYLEKVEFKDALIPLVNSSHKSVQLLTQAADLKVYFGEILGATQHIDTVIDAFEHEETILMPYPGQLLLELVQARYPDKRIDVVPT